MADDESDSTVRNTDGGGETGTMEMGLSFGEDLRTEREMQRISLESVAEGTKVPLHHLSALEQDRYDDLPGGVFNKGIVRSYCQCLGLEAEAWLERLPAAAVEERSPDWTEFAENVKRSRTPSGPRMGLRWWGVLLMLAALGAAGWAVWRYVVQPRVLHAASPKSVVTAVSTEADNDDSLRLKRLSRA